MGEERKLPQFKYHPNLYGQDMVKNGWFTGHLFRCLHCGRYHLRADVA